MRILLFFNFLTVTHAFAVVGGKGKGSSSLQKQRRESIVKLAAKHTIYDFPVSNNGARCRIILDKKGIPESEVTIGSPGDIGGHKSDEYLKINPQGKVPALICEEDGLEIPESDTISRYLLSKYSNLGPTFQPDNPISNLIARYHDMYLTIIQGCLYKAEPPFGPFGTRKDALNEYMKQLKVIEDLIVDRNGMYLCGEEVSLADATLFPSMVFAKHMLPKFDVSMDKIPKINQWYDNMIQNDSSFAKVAEEILNVLKGSWDANGRWDKIMLAGVRDTEPETIFDKIIAGEIPSAIVRQDDKILAFKDINPAAPAHVLVIPKDRAGLSRLTKSSNEHIEILGRLMVTAGEIANDKSLGFGDGARIVINDGPDAGQEVPHLHVHVLGGRQLTWPPG